VSVERIIYEPPARPSRTPAAPPGPERQPVELTIDGEPVSVPAGTTILGDCRARGIETSTLCFL